MFLGDDVGKFRDMVRESRLDDELITLSEVSKDLLDIARGLCSDL